MNGESIIAKLEAAIDHLEMLADHCARQMLKIDEEILSTRIASSFAFGNR